MRIVIAEDEALLRHGLTSLLHDAGVDVAAAVSDARDVAEAVERTRPDLLLTDIRMPPGNTDDGLRTALAAREATPGLGIMVLSQFVQRRYAVELIGNNPAGVGYQLKQRVSDPATFLHDLQRVADGGTALDPEVVNLMVQRADMVHDSLDRLTTRQREVLALLAEGQSNAAIASRLCVSEKAVVAHTSNVYVELGIPPDDLHHRRVLAVLRYLNN
jgi:DNA-binding NarL/FixJ family response regulator